MDIFRADLLFEKIEDKYDTWMTVKTTERIIGYSYFGYITKDVNADIEIINAEHISRPTVTFLYFSFFFNRNHDCFESKQSSFASWDFKSIRKYGSGFGSDGFFGNVGL